MKTSAALPDCNIDNMQASSSYAMLSRCAYQTWQSTGFRSGLFDGRSMGTIRCGAFFVSKFLFVHENHRDNKKTSVNKFHHVEAKQVLQSSLHMCASASFFLVAAAAGAYSRQFCGFFGVATVNIFLSVNKIMLISFNKYFFCSCFEWLIVALHSCGRFNSLHSAVEHGEL